MFHQIFPMFFHEKHQPRSATVWLCGCSEVCLRWFMLLLAKDAEILELLIYWDAFLADLKRFELAGDGRRSGRRLP